MKNGDKLEWQDASCDEILFSAYPFNTGGQFFLVPLQAGKTNASPKYYVDRRNNGLTGINKNLYVLEYVTKGTGYIEYRGVKKKVEKGDLYILNRGVGAYYYADSVDPFEKKWVNITGTLFGELMASVNITDEVFIIRMDAEKYLDEIHNILSDAPQDPDEDRILRFAHVLTDMFYEIYKNKTELQKRSHQVSAEQVGKYISDHITTGPLTISDLADRFALSERHLNRLFQQRYGCSPIKYITARKMECAQNMLIEGRYSIEEISNILHYTSAEYFRKVFIAENGMSPVKWRSAYRAGKITR